MGNRIAGSMLQRSTLADVMRARLRLARVQEQASSGLRINRPSDDPVGYRVAADLRAELAEVQQLQVNQDRAEARMRRADESLSEVQQVVQRARELALQGANGTQDAATRRIIADEIAGLHDQLLSHANVEHNGEFLFAGFASGTAPFASSGAFGSAPPAPAVTFGGDPNEVELEVDSGVRVRTTLDGRRVFQGDGDGDGFVDPGREDLFDTLGDLWEALMLDDPVAVGAQIGRLDRAGTQVSSERTRLAAATQRTEAARESLRTREVELQRQLSTVQDADTVEVLSDLVSRETTLQAALQAAARVMQNSLMDFLR